MCRSAPAQGSTWQGTITLGDIQDLAPELQAQSAVPISVQLAFTVDEGGFCVIKGDLDVTLQLTCQRCLKPLSYPLNSEFIVSPVESDAAAKDIPEQYEPLLVADGEINLASWIAEELYLALPFAPRHEPACLSYSASSTGDEVQEAKKPSPFAVLKEKRKG